MRNTNEEMMKLAAEARELMFEYGKVAADATAMPSRVALEIDRYLNTPHAAAAVDRMRKLMDSMRELKRATQEFVDEWTGIQPSGDTTKN